MNDKIFLDEEKMNLSVDKLRIYKKEEDVLFDNINSLIIDINSSYNTDNKKILNNKVIDIRKKINNISKIHNDNIFVLNKKIDIHTELKNKNISMIEDNKVI